MTGDWYRSTDWASDTRETFFAKLARSRTQRDQYIVIQALTLASEVPEATLELIELYFETRTDDFHDGRAENARMQALMALGRHDDVANSMRAALAFDAANDSLKTGTAMEYITYVVTHRLVDRFKDLEGLLGDTAPHFLMPREGYGWYAAKAVIADHKGAVDEARLFASAALKQADRTTSDLPGHPGLGLVTEKSGALWDWLHGVGRGHTP